MAIVRKSLSDQIYDELKMEIIEQKITFGSKIVNRVLQERFQVSSSPIRDAINRLYSDGLIEQIDNTGATVVNFDIVFYLEVNEILLGITNTAVKLAFKKSDHREIVEYLNRCIALQVQYMGKVEYFKYDYEFHKTFVEFSKNSRLKKLYKQFNVLHEVLLRCFYGKELLKSQKDSIETHRNIVSSFLENNLELCIQLNEEHYNKAEKLFKNMLHKSFKSHPKIIVDE